MVLVFVIQVSYADLLVVSDAKLFEPDCVVALRPVLVSRFQDSLVVCQMPSRGPEESETQLS